MSPDCGTQNMLCSRVEPRNFSFSRGPGRLVITAVVFLPKRLSMRFLRRLDQEPRHRQQAKGQQRLRAALEGIHAPAHFVHALDRVFQA